MAQTTFLTLDTTLAYLETSHQTVLCTTKLPHSLLRQPLGDWSSISDWQWTYSPSENRLYQTTGINFNSWTIVPSRTRQRKFQPGPITTNRPPDVVPATVRFRSPQIAILTGIGTLNHPPVTQPQSLIEHIHALPDTDQWASQQIEVTDEGQDLAHGITDGTATAISDGSFKKGYGTSCSILRGSTITTRIISINTVPGPTDSQSAYRSELAGISGSLLIIQAICNMHHIQNGCITIGLDGQSAMKSVSQKQQPKPQQPDFDLLCDIRTKIL